MNTERYRKSANGSDRFTGPEVRLWVHALCDEIDRLRAQPAASGEPVAWQLPGTDSIITAELKAWRSVLAEQWTTPLYATAQPAPALVTLTNGDLLALWGSRSDGPDNHEIVSYARAVLKLAGTPAKEAPHATPTAQQEL